MVRASIGTTSPRTAVSRIVCPAGRPRISFSLRVAITTPRATVEKRIVAKKTSWKRPIWLRMIPRMAALTMTRPNACPARLTGDFGLGAAPGCFLKRSKLISIPDRNISIMTPIVDIMLNASVVVTIPKRLLPRIIPVTISATAVGTLEMLNRAITSGISRAATITISMDSCSITFASYSSKIIFPIIYQALRLENH